MYLKKICRHISIIFVTTNSSHPPTPIQVTIKFHTVTTVLYQAQWTPIKTEITDNATHLHVEKKSKSQPVSRTKNPPVHSTRQFKYLITTGCNFPLPRIKIQIFSTLVITLNNRLKDGKLMHLHFVALEGQLTSDVTISFSLIRLLRKMDNGVLLMQNCPFFDIILKFSVQWIVKVVIHWM